MHLARRASVMQGRADVQDLAAVILLPRIIDRPRHVPRPLGVNVDDRAESVRAQLLRRTEEIAGRVIDQEVERTQLGDDTTDGRTDRVGVADVGDDRQAATAVDSPISLAAA